MLAVIQCLLGLIVLLIAFAVSYAGAVLFTGITMGLGMLIGFGAANLFFGTALVGMVSYGAVESRRLGYIIAPFMFCFLWAGISVFQRYELEASIPPQLLNNEIPPTARDERTIIVTNASDGFFNLLAHGVVDRIVSIMPADNRQKHPMITETSLGHGEDCAPAAHAASKSLILAGRFDDCLRQRQLADLPDGLVLRGVERQNLLDRSIGCCEGIDIYFRRNRIETLAFSWKRGSANVLSYFPLSFFYQDATNIWDFSTGPLQRVSYGQRNASNHAVLQKLYGVNPIGAIPKIARSLEELVSEARKQLEQNQPGIAFELMVRVQEQGEINDAALKIIVDLIGTDYGNSQNIFHFQRSLQPELRLRFAELALDRLTTPGICSACRPSRARYDMAGNQSSTLRSKARSEFMTRTDLSPWQYQGLLHLIEENPSASHSFGLSVELIQTSVDATLASQGRDFTERAIALQIYQPLLTSEELRAFADKLNLIPDSRVTEFLQNCNPRRLLRTFDRATIDFFQERAHQRVQLIVDDKIRASAMKVLN